MSKKQFPVEEGWLHMELTMRDKTPRSEAELKAIASNGEADSYEFGKVEQYGAKVKVILRQKPGTEQNGRILW